jgi:hypothetical protein
LGLDALQNTRVETRARFYFGCAPLPQHRSLLAHGRHFLSAFFAFRQMFPRGMLWSAAGPGEDLLEMVPNDPMHHFLPSVTCHYALPRV